MMKSVTSVRQQVQVCLGKAGIAVGTLIYVKQGRRENTTFAYEQGWLGNQEGFNVSADLSLISGYQPRRAPSAHDSVFHFAIADTTPDAWGRRVIARDHAKRRKGNPSLASLTEMDYLLAVDDFSRIGALRLRDQNGHYCRTIEDGRRATPPLLELQRIYQASRAVEKGQESTEDLRYLQGKGTSLGGMRPKSTVVDEDGALAIGKFPSVGDTRSVTRGEVLALCLAKQAGINAAPARIIELDGVPVAIIRRFDRDAADGRIPYQSAASLLQASREEDRSYTEIADAIRSVGHAPTADVQQLWRRLVFNLLITNVDDHLQNHGFLHVEKGLWRLAPAFDVNPFPDKERESKTWLSEEDGPITDLEMLLARSTYFSLSREDALAVLAEVYDAVLDWRQIALSAVVGLQASELDDFAPAFEHEQMEAAQALLA
ncbi:type II toxin-antitoxin system HipA family toxin [Pseudomonas helleri]|uniref:Type II toxin-antitoxin system HipA family toxin n=3 Tax=Pseudomonas TaxID=286 RepID=A0A7X2C2I5_9PSED|nr:type II toxin-antitoxin system HipA family toxin [Pseudomonas helleri]MQT59858.1 type II toxin-antitoxin system HipA family toxin [Pseudomonas sp. FSL R10-0399]MQT88222.1 type II toxin-antitoxin system HipA family toxin [Pseudomonas helleri]